MADEKQHSQIFHRPVAERSGMEKSMIKKIKWGVLGTAHIAETQTIPAMIKAENCQLYAIAGRNIEKAENFKKSFGFEKAYGSYDELLEDSTVQAVYIPLPNNMHKEWVIKAAKAGKHILCEKPLSGCESDVIEMINICNKENVLFMEAFAYLHSPLIPAIKKIMDSGEIGEIKMIESTFLTKGYTDNIRIRRENLGGSLYDLGCYNVSLVLRLLDDIPEKVMAIGNFTSEKIDDLFMGYMEFSDGVRASLLAGMCAGTRGDRFFVYGTKGMIEVPIPFNGEGNYKYYVCKGNIKGEISINIPNNYMLEIEQFGRAIMYGEKPFVDNDFSIKAARVNDMCLNAMGY